MNALSVHYSVDHRCAGVSRVAIELLAAMAEARLDFHFSTYVGHEFQQPPRWGELRNLSLAPVHKYRTFRATVGWREKLAGARVWFHPATDHVPSRGVPGVTFVHDVFPLTHPEWFPEDGAFAARLTEGLRHADAAVANSRATVEELRTLFPKLADRTVVAPLGPGRASGAADRVDPLPDRSVLLVSTLEPRKNVARAIRAIERVRATPGFEDVRLVLAGGKGWRAEESESEIERAGEAVVRLGYVTDEEMTTRLATASAVIVPSLSEGFGMPALEAMAAGAPVLVADAGALPEVVGDAALRFDPLSEAAIAEAILDLLSDPVATRARAESARTRAEGFTWSRAAAITLDHLTSVAGGRA